MLYVIFITKFLVLGRVAKISQIDDTRDAEKRKHVLYN